MKFDKMLLIVDMMLSIIPILNGVISCYFLAVAPKARLCAAKDRTLLVFSPVFSSKASRSPGMP
jgi:hypothetical protein